MYTQYIQTAKNIMDDEEHKTQTENASQTNQRLKTESTKGGNRKLDRKDNKPGDPRNTEEQPT